MFELIHWNNFSAQHFISISFSYGCIFDRNVCPNEFNFLIIALLQDDFIMHFTRQNEKQVLLWTPHFDRSNAFPTGWRARFLFEILIFIDYLKMTWSRHLFLFYF